MKIWKWLVPLLGQMFGCDDSGCPKEPTKNLVFVEQCAGQQHLTQGFRAFGYMSYAMDLSYHERCDLLTPIGFCLTLMAIAKIREGGCFHIGCPCWSWIFISMGSTGRRPGAWKGTPGNQKVMRQNILVSRVAVLLEFCNRKKVYWTIEQPESSILEEHPRIAHLLKKAGANKVNFDMGVYGSTSPKKTKLFGTAPFLSQLCKKSTSVDKEFYQQCKSEGLEVTRSYIDSNGKRRCTGGKDLHATQTYPVGFGAAYAKAFHDHDQSTRPHDRASLGFPEILRQPESDDSGDDFDECMFDDIAQWKPIFQG